MTIIGIDPGTTESGFVILTDGKIEDSGVMENNLLLHSIENVADSGIDRVFAIEWIQGMGMAVGKEVFETCFWVGRFAQAAQYGVRLIPRGKIKIHHCHSPRAKDGNIAQELRNKYGQKGTKANPGYFYGVSSHAWQAFAVAAYVLEGAESESEIHI